MPHRRRNSGNGSGITGMTVSRLAKDEVEAVGVIERDRLAEHYRRKEARYEQRVARARSGISLPYVSIQHVTEDGNDTGQGT